jgi:hypothetical protein
MIQWWKRQRVSLFARLAVAGANDCVLDCPLLLACIDLTHRVAVNKLGVGCPKDIDSRQNLSREDWRCSSESKSTPAVVAEHP